MIGRGRWVRAWGRHPDLTPGASGRDRMRIRPRGTVHADRRQAATARVAVRDSTVPLRVSAASRKLRGTFFAHCVIEEGGRPMDAAQVKENVQQASRKVQENLAEGIG